jgi:putative peptidoglycan lipid II flippase
VLILMGPGTIGLAATQVNLFVNTLLATGQGTGAASWLTYAFRLMYLPIGLFGVSIGTAVLPAVSRQATVGDTAAIRQTVSRGLSMMLMLNVPATLGLMVLATPIVRLLFQRGNFDAHSTHIVSVALFWFAFSLPFGGLNLLLTRTFFAVQRPWIPTRLAAINIVIDVIVSVGLYKPFGIAGLIIGTVVANAVMTFLQVQRLRIGFNGRLEGGQTTMITARILLASALLAGVSWAVWRLLDDLLGTSLIAQIASVGGAGAAGLFVYVRAVLAMQVPEAHQVHRLIATQLGRPAPRPSQG